MDVGVLICGLWDGPGSLLVDEVSKEAFEEAMLS